MLTDPLFSPGRIVATHGAVDELQALNPDQGWQELAGTLIARHLSGDWSELPAEDQEQNRLALDVYGARILSAYALRESDPDRKIWIITEADRSVTTLLLPEEY